MHQSKLVLKLHVNVKLKLHKRQKITRNHTNSSIDYHCIFIYNVTQAPSDVHSGYNEIILAGSMPSLLCTRASEGRQSCETVFYKYLLENYAYKQTFIHT